MLFGAVVIGQGKLFKPDKHDVEMQLAETQPWNEFPIREMQYFLCCSLWQWHFWIVVWPYLGGSLCNFKLAFSSHLSLVVFEVIFLFSELLDPSSSYFVALIEYKIENVTTSACFKWKYLNRKAQIFISLMFTSAVKHQTKDKTKLQ